MNVLTWVFLLPLIILLLKQKEPLHRYLIGFYSYFHQALQLVIFSHCFRREEFNYNWRAYYVSFLFFVKCNNMAKLCSQTLLHAHGNPKVCKQVKQLSIYHFWCFSFHTIEGYIIFWNFVLLNEWNKQHSMNTFIYFLRHDKISWLF